MHGQLNRAASQYTHGDQEQFSVYGSKHLHLHGSVALHIREQELIHVANVDTCTSTPARRAETNLWLPPNSDPPAPVLRSSTEERRGWDPSSLDADLISHRRRR